MYETPYSPKFENKIPVTIFHQGLPFCTKTSYCFPGIFLYRIYNKTLLLVRYIPNCQVNKTASYYNLKLLRPRFCQILTFHLRETYLYFNYLFNIKQPPSKYSNQRKPPYHKKKVIKVSDHQ